MTITSLKDLFVEQLRDLYNAETQVQLAYERWADQAASEELSQLLLDRQQQAADHIGHIQDICEALGVNAAGEKCHGMEGLITEGDTFMDDTDDSPVRDAGIVANAQRVEHYFVAGYGCVRTYAGQLGHDDAAEALQQVLDSAAATDERMTQCAEQLLNPEARAAEATAA